MQWCDGHLLLWLVKGECDVLMDSGAAVEELQAAWVREKAQLEQQHQQSQTKVPTPLLSTNQQHLSCCFQSHEWRFLAAMYQSQLRECESNCQAAEDHRKAAELTHAQASDKLAKTLQGVQSDHSATLGDLSHREAQVTLFLINICLMVTFHCNIQYFLPTRVHCQGMDTSIGLVSLEKECYTQCAMMLDCKCTSSPQLSDSCLAARTTASGTRSIAT